MFIGGGSPTRLRMGDQLFLAAVFLTALCFEETHSYRILLIPQGGGSHIQSMTYISEGLVERGHEPFILVPEGAKVSSELKADASSIKVLYYGEEMLDELGPYDHEECVQTNTMRMLGKEPLGLREMMKFAGPIIEQSRRRLLEKNDALLERLRALKFDMAIIDHIIFLSYSFLIPHALGVPWITYTDHIQASFVRVPYLPSFVPTKLLAYSDRMSFKERFVNTMAYVGIAMYLDWSSIPEDLERYQKYGRFSSMMDLLSRSVLFLAPRDVVLDYPSPTMPNLIHVGGLSVKPATGKALPKDIDEFMGDKTSRVIMMTFGSMIGSLPAVFAQKFIDAFRELSEYKIIWRFKNAENLALPNNVMILDWLPQNDIMADPRVKLFITHSGANGQFEAVYHAVPMIGFPTFGDQRYNAERLERRGYGKAMDIRGFTAQELVENVRAIVGDASYKARVGKASEIFRSATETPAQRAAYWIEHVTKFGGAHLRSAGNDLALYQYFLLDVLLVVSVVVVTSLWCAYKLVWVVCRRCRRKEADGRAEKKKSE